MGWTHEKRRGLRGGRKVERKGRQQQGPLEKSLKKVAVQRSDN